MSKTYLLTKSKYIRGLQCLKALYFDVYSPKLARYSPETLALFKGGREFEATYKATYPNGIALDKLLGYKMDQLLVVDMDSKGISQVFCAVKPIGRHIIIAIKSFFMSSKSYLLFV